MKVLEALLSCEPAFLAAGRLALELQGQVRPELKSETGDFAADVVTAADRKVQRLLLEALVETEARTCSLLAEEEEAPELMELFAAESPLCLSLDPIDGTRRYTEGKPYFSLIVSLHDGCLPLYTFVYYPALDWWLRLSDQGCQSSGPPPRLEGAPDLSKVVVYTAGDPRREVPAHVERLEREGHRVENGDRLGPCGSKFLVLSGQAGGYFAGQPNPYDGLFGLHYGLVQGRAVTSTLDLSRRHTGPRGAFYGGYYLVWPPGLAP